MVRPASKDAEAAGTRNEQPRLEEASNKSGLVPDPDKGGDRGGVPFFGEAPLRPIPYIAGLFDAEGTILLSDVRGWFQLHVKLTNSYRPILITLQERFGGHIQEKLGRGRKSRCWSWELTALEESIVFLEQILPFLMTKRDQAALVIKEAPIRFSEATRRRVSDLNCGIIKEENSTRRFTGEESVQYMAGFFDGEGCVTIAKASERRHWLQIRVGGVDAGTLEWVRENFGGCIGKQRRYSERHRQAWYWQLQASGAGKFLTEILRYSVIKRPQIEIGLRFRKECAKAPGANHLTEAELQRREFFKQKLSSLNFNKGKRPTTGRSPTQICKGEVNVLANPNLYP